MDRACATCETLAEKREKNGEIDRAGRLFEHRVDLRVARNAAHRRVKIAKVALVDDAVFVLIHDAERLQSPLPSIRANKQNFCGIKTRKNSAVCARRNERKSPVLPL